MAINIKVLDKPKGWSTITIKEKVNYIKQQFYVKKNYNIIYNYIHR